MSMNRKWQGFTLVELIVAIGIVVVMSGLAVSTLSRTGEKTTVVNEAKQITDLIQAMRRKAVAGEKPQGCLLKTLEGYEIRFVSTTRIEGWAICQGSDTLVQAVDLVSGQIGLPDVGTTKRIDVLSGATREVDIYYCGSGYELLIEVTSAGSTSAPQEVDAGNC